MSCARATLVRRSITEVLRSRTRGSGATSQCRPGREKLTVENTVLTGTATLEALDLEGQTHSAASRTSIFPVTAAVISALRYSSRRSMARSTFATTESTLSASRSRKSAIARPTRPPASPGCSRPQNTARLDRRAETVRVGLLFRKPMCAMIPGARRFAPSLTPHPDTVPNHAAMVCVGRSARAGDPRGRFSSPPSGGLYSAGATGIRLRCSSLTPTHSYDSAANSKGGCVGVDTEFHHVRGRHRSRTGKQCGRIACSGLSRLPASSTSGAPGRTTSRTWIYSFRSTS